MHRVSTTLLALKTVAITLGAEEAKADLLNTLTAYGKSNCAVLLSVDGVYKNGKYIEAESGLVISNDYIIDLVKRNKNVLFGASVHPYREAREMMAETRRCIGEGAVLFNWMPSVQQIDPEDDRCIPFYISLAKEGIPLLCHTGAAFEALKSGVKKEAHDNPRKLGKALDIGVKVIVVRRAPENGAIVAGDKDYFDGLMEMLMKSRDNKWELYADISSFCTPVGAAYLERIKREGIQGHINPGRLLYEKGFPIVKIDMNAPPISPEPHELCENIRNQSNLLDCSYDVLKTFMINDSLFTNIWNVLRL